MNKITWLKVSNAISEINRLLKNVSDEEIVNYLLSSLYDFESKIIGYDDISNPVFLIVIHDALCRRWGFHNHEKFSYSANIDFKNYSNELNSVCSKILDKTYTREFLMYEIFSAIHEREKSFA